jgi:serine/threonine protein kinase
MGQLHLATKSGLEGFTKIAAVKCILPELAETPEFRRMFLEEARVAARLDHPNIVTTYELGEEHGLYFIAMEYLPGEDLAAILGRGRVLDQRMPIGIALAIASACAEGLHFAHELPGLDGKPSGLVHRDVNPANVVVTYHGAVKLLDFGIAKMRGSANRTGVGSFRGKLRYAAPEQVEGKTADRRTDVFCLGAVLWECLTNMHLFDGTSEAELIGAICHRTVLPPGRFRNGIPAELDDIVLKALERSPAARFQTAAEMSAALSRVELPNGQDARSPHRVVRFMESVFGAERAMLKVGIARGQRLQQSLKELNRARGASQEVRPEISGFKTAWVSDLEQPVRRAPAVPREVTEKPYPAMELTPVRKSRWFNLGLIAGMTALAAILFWLGPIGAEKQALPRPRFSLGVTSSPPGASIYLDGEPTGRKTPAIFESMANDQPIEVRVMLAGYRSESTGCAPGAACDFHLEASTGSLEIEGLPPEARMFVDGKEVPASSKLKLPVGRRVLRIERADELIFEGAVDIELGGSVLRLREGG